MTDAEGTTLVLRDQAGEYYLLPVETLEQGRVPAEQKAALEERLAALPPATGDGDDVQGYIVHILAAVVFFGTGLSLGYAITENYIIPHPAEPASISIPVEPERIR